MEAPSGLASTTAQRDASSARADATLSQSLAEFVTVLGESSVPTEVAADATWRLSDCIGVSFVGSRQEFASSVLAVLKEWGGRPEAVVIGSDVRAPAPLAAMANGTFAHGADYDDTHGLAVVHITSVVVPTALALAQRLG